MPLSQNNLPSGQEWFISRMQNLNYVSDPLGLCFGVAHMGMQAILANDLHNFEQRLKSIYNIPATTFGKTIDSFKRQQLSLIKRIKNQPGFPKNFNELNKQDPKEVERLRNDLMVQDKLAALKSTITRLVDEKILTEKEEATELKRRADLLLYNAFVQRKLDEALLKLPEKQRLALDIPAFLEGVELYQRVYLYPHLFNEQVRPKMQNAALTFPLVTSQKIEEQGGISKLSEFSGVYTEKELAQYFDSFSEALKDTTQDQPIALVLRSSNHAITVGFKPKQKEWFFIDANQLQHQHVSANEIATSVSSALSDNGIAVFSTEIYANQANQEVFKNSISTWQNQKSWQEMHNESAPDKAKLTDSYNVSWLYIAARQGQTDVVKKLLAAKTDPNQAEKDGTTPLFRAVQNERVEVVRELLAAKADPNLAPDDGINPLMMAAYNGRIDIVKELLAAKADPNQASNEGTTSLLMATQDGYIDIVKELLAAKADPNHADVDGNTSLFTAAYNGHIDIVKELLAAKANPNQATNNSVSPLFIAAQNGHLNLILILLENKADITTAFNSNIPSLRNFAKKRQIEKRMNDVIHEKRSFLSSKIAVTPAEIANIMGHTEIADLLSYKYMLQNQSLRPPSRNAAFQRCYQQCLNAKNDDDVKKALRNFKTLDVIAQRLMNITETYHSATIFHGKNEEREKSITELRNAIEKAYNSFGKDTAEENIKLLENTAREISKHTKANHEEKGTRILTKFFTSSRLARRIDEVVLPTPPSILPTKKK